jgi:hypothetical protein
MYVRNERFALYESAPCNIMSEEHNLHSAKVPHMSSLVLDACQRVYCDFQGLYHGRVCYVANDVLLNGLIWVAKE